jgi:Flp pilus assembly protein TadG
MTSNADSFRRDEGGAILVFWAISLAVILGIVALSFDMGRMATTQSELQSYADHVALAAAGELDGRSDSLTRASAAAANFVTGHQSFGNGAQTLSGGAAYALAFFDRLPANDASAMTAGQTTVPEDAIYARVVVTPQTIGFTFGAAFYALTGAAPASNVVGATAVAGFTQYACDITPLMFCLPSPGYKADQNIGDMILLRSGGQGAAWGPGDFGFLDPSKAKVDPKGPCGGLNGAQLDACLLGATGSITQCFSMRGVDTEPGQKVGIEDSSFNVRFDIYKAIMNGKKNNPAYAPAPNVIKGIVPNGGGACIGGNPQASPDSVGLPRDGCFGSGTCGGNGRFGDGNWSVGRAAYVSKNYGGGDPHPGATTRYNYYLAEIATHGGGGSTTPILAGRAETGRPQCSAQQSNDPDRRVVIAAAIDCQAHPITGRATNVPVEEFFRMFLTEPVGTDALSPPTLDLWVEVVGSAGGPGAGGGPGAIFHDVVQLYR